jgi:hypothetical protein
LVDRSDTAWRLTAKARRVLAGEADAWHESRQPRWLGGFRLSDGVPRWDAGRGTLRCADRGA